MLLFLRPSNGVYLPPQVLRLKGKSTVVEVGVTQKDMPNFFVEAGDRRRRPRLHRGPRNSRAAGKAGAQRRGGARRRKEYKPGQKAKVKVKLTDFVGKPFVGSTVLSIYDKSVEYISGGSNVPEIKEFFWKWRRHHRPYIETNLDRWFANLVPHGQTDMENLGVFGGNGRRRDESKKAKCARRRINGSSTPEWAAAAAGGGAAAGAAANGEGRRWPVPMQPPFDAEKCRDAGELRAVTAATEPRQRPLVQPTIRSEFADTALWSAALETNKDGIAEVELDMPEEPHRLEDQGLGHGPRHQGRPGRGRGRHQART